MSVFPIRYPFFILMACLIIIVDGVTTVARMPVDLFPGVNIPVVVVAPLARAIRGALTVSGLVTVFLVPTAYLLIHRREEIPVIEGKV